jgi:hypothetical protein
MVERFILPEWRASSVENAIRAPRGNALQHPHQRIRRCMRKNKPMHVIRHNHVFENFVSAKLPGPTLDLGRNHSGYSRIVKPAWATRSAVEKPVRSDEFFTGGFVGICRTERFAHR